MDADTFHHWLDNFARAWELREPRAAIPLFAEDMIYHDTPFSEPIHGHAAMVTHLETMFRAQDESKFDYEILTVTPDIGIAQWWLSFKRVPGNVPTRWDGIALVNLDSRGLCKTYHQWWHAQENHEEN